MASLRIKFLATSVQMQMHLLVFLPESVIRAPGAADRRRLKVLWLLHGEGGDCSDWVRLSMVEHYAQAANIALVMPNVDNSMYMDMAHGGYPYFMYLTQELPRHVRGLVQVLSPRREDNFVAGVSVGGYGAVKWLLRAPETFSAGACLSGDIDIVSALRAKQAAGEPTTDWEAAFGDPARIAGTADDILHLARETAGSAEAPPRIFLAFASGDESAERNRRAARLLRESGLEIDCREEPHDGGWTFWDARIRDFIVTVAAGEAGGR